MPALQFAVGLRIIWAGQHMAGLPEPNEFLEVLGDELRPVVANDPGPGLRMLFARLLQHDLGVGFLHRLAYFPMHDITAGPVQNRAQVVKGAANIDERKVDVPMLVRLERLHKAGAFARGFLPEILDQPGSFHDSVNAAGTHGHHVSIEHHEGQPPIAFQRILSGKLDDGAFFPILQPVVAWHQAIVFVGLAKTFLPAVVFSRGKLDPAEHPLGGELGAAGPVADKIHHLVPDVMGDPGHAQLSPSSFFNWMCSAMISAMTSSLVLSFSSSLATFCSIWLAARGLEVLAKAAAPFSKKVFCHW